MNCIQSRKERKAFIHYIILFWVCSYAPGQDLNIKMKIFIGCTNIPFLKSWDKMKKTKYNDLQIVFTLCSIEYSTRLRYLMFKSISIIYLFQKYAHIFEFVERSKKEREGQEMTLENCGMPKKYLSVHTKCIFKRNIQTNDHTLNNVLLSSIQLTETTV